jgi:hypothetical protein
MRCLYTACRLWPTAEAVCKCRNIPLFTHAARCRSVGAMAPPDHGISQRGPRSSIYTNVGWPN